MANYRDEDWLYEQYVEKGLTQAEISEEAGCGQHTISRWLRRYDIDTRDKSDYVRHPCIRMNNKGYYIVRCQAGDTDDRFYLHRLLAVAEYGLDEVAESDVHHMSGCTWDNRPKNIELLTPGEHMSEHRMEEIENGEKLEDRFK